MGTYQYIRKHLRERGVLVLRTPRTSVRCAKERLAIFPIIASFSKGATRAFCLASPQSSLVAIATAYACEQQTEQVW